jgi:cofilin
MTANLDEQISAGFAEIRRSKKRYMVIKMSEDYVSVQCEHLGERDSSFEDFLNHVPKDQPRFLVYDLEYSTGDGRKQSKLLFIMYSPDQCSEGKLRFAYANNKEIVKAKCSPINKEFQINDHADLSQQSWIEEFS